MTLHFLHDDLADTRPGDVVELGGAEAHHAAAVRRVRVGEAVSVGDGRGVWVEGVCTAASPRAVTVAVSARREVPRPAVRVVLVQALAKGDRDELAVQAATELGVDGIVPWQAERSVARWVGDKAERGRTRWASIVREAAKQAHRAWVPEVEALATVATLCDRASGAQLLVLDPTAPRRLAEVGVGETASEVLIVVGAEGGIADPELRALESAGGERVRLGETVLRTSTAGPAALAVLNLALGRW